MNFREKIRYARYPRWLTLFFGAVTIVFVGVLDGITGPDYSFSVFYLVPVVFSAWFAGRSCSVFIALFGALTWLVADMAGKSIHSNPLALIWNEVIELSLFLFAAFTISALRGRLDYEEELSRTDQLTGIANRRMFYENAGEEIQRCRRYGSPFTLVYLDIDNFKGINDTSGHQEGDLLLQRTAGILKGSVRASDLAARLGGDEYGILLPETTENAAVAVTHKIRTALTEQIEARWPVTFSIGMITYHFPPDNVDELVNKAEQLMYEVKKHHKNDFRHAVVTT